MQVSRRRPDHNFEQTIVTLNQLVVFYRLESDESEHMSLMRVSDLLGHTPSTVLTFINKYITGVTKSISQ